MWDVYTYGGGDYLVQVFGAVSLFFGGPFQSLAQVAGLMGLIAILMSYLGPKHNIDLAYILRFAVFYGALFVPKADIAVVDRITPVVGGGVVAQVPFGLAMFAHFTSFIGDRLTTLYETAMAFPADQRYQQNGMVFGSTLMKKTPQLNFSDATFSGDMSSFLDICAASLFANDPTLVDQVEKSQDIWGLLSGLAQTNRWVQISTSPAPMTCQDAANDLTARIPAEENTALMNLGKIMWPYKTSAVAQADASNLLSPTALDLAAINMNSSQMVRQAMMVNAIEAGLDRLPPTATAGALAAIQAKTAAEKQRENVYMTMGAVASRSIPLMRSILEAIAYGLFPVVGVMILLPMGLSAFLNYFVVLMWLQMWPVLYAILNSIIYWYAQQANTTGAMMPTGLTDWTMWSLPGIMETNSEIVALAGYMAISIPMISYMLVRGGAQIGSQVAAHLTQPAQQAAQTAGSQAAMGNMQMGVVAMDTLSANNSTQWQYKTGFSYDGNTAWRGGMHTQQDGLDQVRTDTRTGQVAYDSRLQVSDVGAAVNWRAANDSAYTRAYDQAVTAGSSEVLAGARGRIAAYEKALGYSAEHANDTTHRTGSDYARSVEVGKAASDLKDFTDRFSVGGNYTRQDAATLAGLATLDGKDVVAIAAQVLPVGRFTKLMKGSLAKHGRGSFSETDIENYYHELNHGHGKKGILGEAETRNQHGFPVHGKGKDAADADPNAAEHAPETGGRARTGVTASLRGAIDTSFRATLDEVSQYVKSHKLDDKASEVERAQLDKADDSRGDTIRRTGSDQDRSSLRVSTELIERGEATLQKAETLRKSQTQSQGVGVNVTVADNEAFVAFLRREGKDPNDFYARTSEEEKAHLTGKFQQEYAERKGDQLLAAAGLSALPPDRDLEDRITGKNEADRTRVQGSHNPEEAHAGYNGLVHGRIDKSNVRPDSNAPAGYGSAAKRGHDVQDRSKKNLESTENGLGEIGTDTQNRVEKKMNEYSGSGASNTATATHQGFDEVSGGSTPEKPRHWGEPDSEKFHAQPGRLKKTEAAVGEAVDGAKALGGKAVDTVKGWFGDSDAQASQQQQGHTAPVHKEIPATPPQPATFRGGNAASPAQPPAKTDDKKDEEPSLGAKVGGVILGSVFQTWDGLNREADKHRDDDY